MTKETVNTTMEAIQVFRDDFDNMENRKALHSTLLGTFIKKDKLTAQGNAGEFIESLAPTKMYLGWNGKVYPQIRLEKIQIR